MILIFGLDSAAFEVAAACGEDVFVVAIPVFGGAGEPELLRSAVGEAFCDDEAPSDEDGPPPSLASRFNRI